MKANKVDIIIPVYNVEAYLRRCLNSMLAQTYTHWRAICVDDGSTDGSPAILDEYAAKDSRFKVIHQENGGLSHARNEGMAVADAKYVMFVDSDDFIHPQTWYIYGSTATTRSGKLSATRASDDPQNDKKTAKDAMLTAAN